jgi:hypothetical protein
VFSYDENEYELYEYPFYINHNHTTALFTKFDMVKSFEYVPESTILFFRCDGYTESEGDFDAVHEIASWYAFTPFIQFEWVYLESSYKQELIETLQQAREDNSENVLHDMYSVATVTLANSKLIMNMLKAGSALPYTITSFPEVMHWHIDNDGPTISVSHHRFADGESGNVITITDTQSGYTHTYNSNLTNPTTDVFLTDYSGYNGTATFDTTLGPVELMYSLTLKPLDAETVQEAFHGLTLDITNKGMVSEYGDFESVWNFSNTGDYPRVRTLTTEYYVQLKLMLPLESGLSFRNGLIKFTAYKKPFESEEVELFNLNLEYLERTEEVIDGIRVFAIKFVSTYHSVGGMPIKYMSDAKTLNETIKSKSQGASNSDTNFYKFTQNFSITNKRSDFTINHLRRVTSLISQETTLVDYDHDFTTGRFLLEPIALEIISSNPDWHDVVTPAWMGQLTGAIIHMLYTNLLHTVKISELDKRITALDTPVEFGYGRLAQILFQVPKLDEIFGTVVMGTRALNDLVRGIFTGDLDDIVCASLSMFGFYQGMRQSAKVPFEPAYNLKPNGEDNSYKVDSRAEIWDPAENVSATHDGLLQMDPKAIPHGSGGIFEMVSTPLLNSNMIHSAFKALRNSDIPVVKNFQNTLAKHSIEWTHAFTTITNHARDENDIANGVTPARKIKYVRAVGVSEGVTATSKKLSSYLPPEYGDKLNQAKKGDMYFELYVNNDGTETLKNFSEVRKDRNNYLTAQDIVLAAKRSGFTNKFVDMNNPTTEEAQNAYQALYNRASAAPNSSSIIMNAGRLPDMTTVNEAIDGFLRESNQVRYHPLRNNCQHFAKELIKFLTEREKPSWMATTSWENIMNDLYLRKKALENALRLVIIGGCPYV